MGKRLKAIKGFTPVEFVAKKMGKESTEFAQELYNKNLGLDRYSATDYEAITAGATTKTRNGGKEKGGEEWWDSSAYGLLAGTRKQHCSMLRLSVRSIKTTDPPKGYAWACACRLPPREAKGVILSMKEEDIANMDSLSIAACQESTIIDALILQIMKMTKIRQEEYLKRWGSGENTAEGLENVSNLLSRRQKLCLQYAKKKLGGAVRYTLSSS
ncbi:hypothetical protein AGMMS49949_07100 [Alphaproteobacteria bacterium]|nr:hypothetical protein AGMMS49949_07100 [Alphaproteobacteria bacterium]GHS98719.1 hypothetical protein AGMMS50296_6560 [Alphaproteobacteria bacterium]